MCINMMKVPCAVKRYVLNIVKRVVLGIIKYKVLHIVNGAGIVFDSLGYIPVL